MSIGNLSSTGKKENTNINKIYRTILEIRFNVGNTTYTGRFSFYSSTEINGTASIKNYINSKGTVYGNCYGGCFVVYQSSTSTTMYYVTQLMYNSNSDTFSILYTNSGTGSSSTTTPSSIGVWSSSEI